MRIIKHILAPVIFLLLGYTGFSQAQTITAQKLVATQTIYLRGVKVDTLSTDTNLTANSDDVLSTQRAIKTYIKNHSGSGGTDTIFVWNGILAQSFDTIGLGGFLNRNTQIGGHNLYRMNLDSLTSFNVYVTASLGTSGIRLYDKSNNEGVSIFPYNGTYFEAESGGTILDFNDSTNSIRQAVIGVTNNHDLFEQVAGNINLQAVGYFLQSLTTSILDTTNNKIVVWNSSTGRLTKTTWPLFVSADNGVSITASDTVQLGGALTKNTSINEGGFGLFLSSNSTTSQNPFVITVSGIYSGGSTSQAAIAIQNSKTGPIQEQGISIQLFHGVSGSGIIITADSNNGVYAQSNLWQGNTAGVIMSTNSGNSPEYYALQTSFVDSTSIQSFFYARRDMATATHSLNDGAGLSIDLTMDHGYGVSISNVQTLSLQSVIVDTTTGAEKSEFRLFGNNSGTFQQLLTVKSTGQQQLNKYHDSTSFPGTATGYLAIDVNGNIITKGLPGSGGGGGGNTNSNIGSGFRFAVPGTNNIKTLFCAGCTLDSTTNANALTITVSGGGSSFTRQVFNTGGATVTVTGGNFLLTVDPATATAVLTITLPASPTDLQAVEIEFGGTITSGVVITSLTVVPNSGQTVIDTSPISGTSVTPAAHLKYIYRSATSQWYRRQ